MRCISSTEVVVVVVIVVGDVVVPVSSPDLPAVDEELMGTSPALADSAMTTAASATATEEESIE